MIATRYVRKEVSSKAARPSRVQPDQALSVDEIVRRFTRGIPADVSRFPAVYIDQAERDLEQVSRMDFADKAALAAELAQQRAQAEAELAELAKQREAHEAEARERDKRELEKSREAAPKIPPAQAG